MAKKLKFLIIILFVLIGLFVAASFAVALYGKKFAESAIKQNLNMEASIGSVSLRMPLTIDVKKIKIGSLFYADDISFSPNIFGLLAARIVLDNLLITNPIINIEQASGGRLSLPNFKQKGKQPPVFVTGLRIDNGRVVFVDKKAALDGYTTILDKITLRISKVMLPPTSLNAKFSFSAVLADVSLRPIGTLSGNGWIDFGRKDMDADLEARGIEVNHFALYYGDFLSNKKLLSANLDLVSNFKSVDNNLVIKTNFKLSKLVYAPEEQVEGQLPEINLARNALDLFADREGNVIFDFTVNTELDNPNVTVEELKKIMIQAAVKNLSSQSPQDLVEKAATMIEKYKDIGKQLKKIFKGD